jgi:hypothetical protein
VRHEAKRTEAIAQADEDHAFLGEPVPSYMLMLVSPGEPTAWIQTMTGIFSSAVFAGVHTFSTGSLR